MTAEQAAKAFAWAEQDKLDSQWPTGSAYVGAMPSKPIPPDVVRDFLDDMNAFFAEPNTVKADAIAVRQLHALEQYYDGVLRLTDVKALFVQMRDEA